MSSRPQLNPETVILNGDMSGSLTSDVTIIQKLSQISYDIAWTNGSSPVGTMSVQVSNTYSQDASGAVKNAGNWQTLTLTGTAPTISGSSGNGFIDLGATGAYAIRLVYTRVSGSGTMNATISAKVS